MLIDPPFVDRHATPPHLVGEKRDEARGAEGEGRGERGGESGRDGGEAGREAGKDKKGQQRGRCERRQWGGSVGEDRVL